MPIHEASGHEIWPAWLPVSAADLTYPTARRLFDAGCLDAVGLACEQRRMRADNPAYKADTLQRYGPYWKLETRQFETGCKANCSNLI